MPRNASPTGAILAALIPALGPISSAHFNPAVSPAPSLRKDQPRREFIPYAGAQFAGALAGLAVMRWVFAPSNVLDGLAASERARRAARLSEFASAARSGRAKAS